MEFSAIKTVIIILVLTLISGWGDSQGFVHSSKVWEKGKFIWSEAGLSALGYIFGTVVFWLAIKYLQEVKVFSAEVQTLFWFSTVIVGVAIASGKFFQWDAIDKIIGIAVLVGIAILLFRVGE
jgi:hypothetical protein